MRTPSVILAVLLVADMSFAQHPQTSYSYLEIYDVPSRTHRVVKEFPYVVEAPNWTPDGKWLVVNKGGRLYKTAPDGSSDLIEIDTGEITQCNNDHVISADGKWMGISGNDPANKHHDSYVYTFPFAGGQPKRLTPEGPSYLHGISPDGRMVAYCAFRGPDKDPDVYTMPVRGGVEKRLTDSPGLDDGPEYSPDGKFIWFNSLRSGKMQVWRMRNDGRQQTRMTFDEDMNSWFPHVSPDGKKVVYIAYHDYEIDPGSHVANLNVQLRMIPAEGGEPEILTELFGGQGSLNVNSWSPDSRQFAYVSYRIAEEMTAPAREMAVQLYSVRSLLGTPELFAGNHGYVLGRLAQMGYTAVEAAGYEDGKFYGLAPDAFKSAVEEAGLKILSSHTTRPLSSRELSSGDFSQAMEWWDKCIAAHKAAGIPYLVMSWSQPLKSKKDMAVMAGYLDSIGSRCREEGLRFGYHCHSHEFVKNDGTTMLDVFAAQTKPENVFIQMDVYWAVMAGASPVEYMTKYPGRYELMHIKDKYEIGQSGMVGFDAIFKAFPRAGTKAFVVELEQASTPNILKGLRESALYLRNASF